MQKKHGNKGRKLANEMGSEEGECGGVVGECIEIYLNP